MCAQCLPLDWHPIQLNSHLMAVRQIQHSPDQDYTITNTTNGLASDINYTAYVLYSAQGTIILGFFFYGYGHRWINSCVSTRLQGGRQLLFLFREHL